MRVKILRNTVASGFDVEAGEECELSDQDALILIRLGKAEKSTEKAETKQPKTKRKKQDAE